MSAEKRGREGGRKGGREGGEGPYLCSSDVASSRRE
jgi:hypothetical protein